MGEGKVEEDWFKTGYLEIPKGTVFLTGPVDVGGAKVGEASGEAEEPQRVKFYERLSREEGKRYYHRLTDGRWISQELVARGKDGKRRFLDKFGDPIGPAEEKSGK